MSSFALRDLPEPQLQFLPTSLPAAGRHLLCYDGLTLLSRESFEPRLATGHNHERRFM